jgi:Zn-dependent peptidase ImmA (M78 family)
MSKHTRAAVEKMAAKLLEDQRISAPPVDVEQVARSQGYSVVYKYFEEHDLSGTVVRDAEGSITIGINTLHPHVRQRFSVAHEVGHAMMHLAKGEDLIVDPPSRSFFNRDEQASLGEDSREIEANQFAAALLMPPHFIAGVGNELLADSSGMTITSLIDRLATRFDVSTQAMKFRMVNLGVIEPE